MTDTTAFDKATTPPTLRQRLSDCMALIGGIRKDKKNQHGGYPYLSEEAVKRAVQDALMSAQLIPEIEISILNVHEVKSSKGGLQLLYDAKATIIIRDGEEMVRSEGLGSGIDYADKGLMKAQTAALREAWKSLFCIPSGTDPEAYPDGERAESKTDLDLSVVDALQASRKHLIKVARDHEARVKARREAAPKTDLDLSPLTEQRKRLDLQASHVKALAAHVFGAQRMADLEQGQVVDLSAMMARMDPRVVAEVREGSMKSVPTFSGAS